MNVHLLEKSDERGKGIPGLAASLLPTGHTHFCFMPLTNFRSTLECSQTIPQSTSDALWRSHIRFFLIFHTVTLDRRELVPSSHVLRIQSSL
nr:hypothetical protein CFP56_37145 [Quercus suber]